MHEYIVAVILGIVEGLTEFIPVSSTGHMILVGDMLDFNGPIANAFEVVIQLGAILAVVIAYRERFAVMLRRENWFRRDGLSLVHIFIGMVPACGLAFFCSKLIKTYLFSYTTVIIGLIIGALFMIFAERVKPRIKARTVDDITYRQALQIGLFQCMSLWPGFSRSGSTIAGAMIVGVSRKAGADFTFMMAVPIMMLASAHDFLKVYQDLHLSDFVTFGIGFLVAFVVAYLSILWFLNLLKKFNLLPFAYYRIFIAIVAAIYFMFS